MTGWRPRAVLTAFISSRKPSCIKALVTRVTVGLEICVFAHFASGQRPVFADAVHHGLCVVFTEIKRFVTCKPCFHFFALLPSLLLSQAVAGSHGRKNGPQLLYPSILQSESAKQAARQTEEYPASAQLGRILKAEKHITCCAVPRLLRVRQAGNWP